MRDLSVLTPPLLVCVAVIVAIVAFLRHEMGRSRSGRPPGDGDTSPAEQADNHRHERPEGADASPAGADDSGTRT